MKTKAFQFAHLSGLGLHSTKIVYLMPLALALTLALGNQTSAHATIIQVLHTNDLHAALNTHGEPAPSQAEFGGWAQVKTVLDRLEKEAKNQGIETLKLDAGDFSEGTMTYFPDYGTNVLKAFQKLGFDAAALGNHDWMLGARDMNKAFGMAPFPFPVLASNVHISKRLQNLKSQILPSTIIEKSGIKIGIVGVTTDEAFYKWIPRVGSRRNELKIKKMYASARREARRLREKTDVVLALTHIGTKKDRVLVSKVKDIDVVVGGHSHTTLDVLAFEKNPEGREIPIVQTGFNGKHVGRFFLEVLPGKDPQVLSYELVPVLKTEEKDPEIDALVQHANQRLDEFYGKDHLDQPIGQSEVRLVPGSKGPSAFAKFASESMREAAQSRISLDIGSFHNNTVLPGGTVTRRTLMESYPRKFEVNQNEGWYVYKAWVPGWLVKFGIKFAVDYGIYVSMDGVKFDVVRMSEEEFATKVERARRKGKSTDISPYKAVNIRLADPEVNTQFLFPENSEQPIEVPIQTHGESLIGGSKNSLCNFCWYSIGTSEGLIRGAYSITKLTHLIIRKGHSVGTTIWDAFQTQLTKIGTIRKLNPQEQINGQVIDTSNSYGQAPDVLNKTHFPTQLSSEERDPDIVFLPWVNPDADAAQLFEQFKDEARILSQKKDDSEIESLLNAEDSAETTLSQ